MSPADEEVQPSSGAAPLAAERIVAGQGEEPTAGAIRVLEKARLSWCMCRRDLLDRFGGQ